MSPCEKMAFFISKTPLFSENFTPHFRQENFLFTSQEKTLFLMKIIWFKTAFWGKTGVLRLDSTPLP